MLIDFNIPFLLLYATGIIYMILFHKEISPFHFLVAAFSSATSILVGLIGSAILRASSLDESPPEVYLLIIVIWVINVIMWRKTVSSVTLKSKENLDDEE